MIKDFIDRFRYTKIEYFEHGHVTTVYSLDNVIPTLLAFFTKVKNYVYSRRRKAKEISSE